MNSEKLYIYGAGDWCRSLLASECLASSYVSGVIDQQQSRWGERIGNTVVVSLQEAMYNGFDRIIISVKYKDNIVLYLRSKGISVEKLWFYKRDEDMLEAVKPYIREIENRALFHEEACEIVKKSMLYECYQNGEWEKSTRLIVIGAQEDKVLIERFVSKLCDIIVSDYSADMEIGTTDKLIFTGQNYREQLERYRSDLGLKNWIILPFFDVDRTIH